MCCTYRVTVATQAVIARRDPDATLALRELRERGCSFDAVVIEGGGDAVVEGGCGTRPQQRWLNWLDHTDLCSAFGVPPHEAAAPTLTLALALAHALIRAAPIFTHPHPHPHPLTRSQPHPQSHPQPHPHPHPWAKQAAARVLCVGTIALSHVDVEARHLP